MLVPMARLSPGPNLEATTCLMRMRTKTSFSDLQPSWPSHALPCVDHVENVLAAQQIC